MSLERVTPSNYQVIETEDAKRHLRIPHTDTCEEQYIEDLIKSASFTCEDWTNRSFLLHTWKQTLDCFPFGRTLYLERATPLVSVTSVQYYDQDNTLTTFSSSSYIVDTSQTPGLDRDWETI